MAITSSQSNNDGILRRATGAHLDDAASPAAVTLTLGFTPKYVLWLNATDRDGWEWFDGMADGTTLKTVAAGTRTLDTSDAAIDVDGGTVTIPAAILEQNKQYYWVAIE
jgi:hypothetical protein